MSKLTHFNQAGEAHMVDIADKASTARRAWSSMSRSKTSSTRAP